MKFDPSQEAALVRIIDTLRSEAGEFTLGGLAGSGKSVVVSEALKRTTVNVAVVSFTGKAVDVLRKKGIRQAQTLHSLMYEFDPETRVFHKRPSLPCQAVIVDEASMINRDLYMDLKSFGTPIVWVGDHGQLEPIGDNPNIMAKPDMVLERIYRQAEGSAILDVAHAFRIGKIPNWKAGPEVARLTFNQAMETILDYDVVLCGTNITRRNTNQHIRRKKGHVLAVEAGETMVCLRNNKDLAVFNGMLLRVVKVHYGQTLYLDLEEIGTKRLIPRVKCHLIGDEPELPNLDRETVILDYGYCLSAHKAQGSEMSRVLVIEERGGWDMRRWRYTCATRASKFLAWTT